MVKLINYEVELQEAIDVLSKYYSNAYIDIISDKELQYEYGKVLAAEARKADKLVYMEMLNELDRYVTSQYKDVI
jgi:hypothetical protein